MEATCPVGELTADSHINIPKLVTGICLRPLGLQDKLSAGQSADFQVS